MNMMIAETPWTNLWKQDLKLTSDWQTFSFDVTPSANTDNARVTFSPTRRAGRRLLVHRRLADGIIQ